MKNRQVTAIFLAAVMTISSCMPMSSLTAFAAENSAMESTENAEEAELVTQNPDDSEVQEETNTGSKQVPVAVNSAMEDESEDIEKEVADEGDILEEPAAANAEESPEGEVSDASSEGLTDQTTTGKDDNETAEEELADESGENTVEKDGKKTGEEDSTVVLQSSVVNDPAITMSAQYDLNMFPEIASLHVEKWENPESVTHVTEAIQLLVGENPQWETEDICSIRIFSSQFLDGSGNPYSSDTNGQVSYFLDLPSEETANNYTFFVYDVSDDGTPVLMEYENIDAEQAPLVPVTMNS